ncbi:MAG: hypothetical protein JO206_08375, partial [Solirubrobacterales bacterium]|nr:hypothetical protein [Solirubrobacterales bacterium]
MARRSAAAASGSRPLALVLAAIVVLALAGCGARRVQPLHPTSRLTLAPQILTLPRADPFASFASYEVPPLLNP